MAKYLALIVAINLLLGTLLYHHGHVFGLRKKTAMVITGVSIVMGFSFPVLLMYLKLRYVLLIMFLVLLYLAILIHRQNDAQSVVVEEPELVELKTAEQYLQDANWQQAASSELTEQYTKPLYAKEVLENIIEPEKEAPLTEEVKESIAVVETENNEELIVQDDEAIPSDIEIEEVMVVLQEELEEEPEEELEEELEVELEEELEEEPEEELEVEPEVEPEEEPEVELEAEPEEEIAEVTVDSYINQAFTYRDQSDDQGALAALAKALELTTDINLNLLITLEISSIYKESGQYELATSIIGAYIAQFGQSLNAHTRLELLLNYQYIEIIQGLLLENDLKERSLKSIPELIIKQAEEKLEKWKRQLLA